MSYPAICFVVLSILSLVDPSVQKCRIIADCYGGTGQCESVLGGGLTGPKGEPGCSCENKEAAEPELYFATNSLPYAAAEGFCNGFGRTLCKFDDICKPVDNGRTLVTEVIRGDHWVPIADEFNDWVQIGDAYVNACFRHTEGLSREASWGHNSDSVLYRGYVYCCPAPTPEVPDMIYDYIGKAATYDSSRTHCQSRNMRLCYSSEICQDSLPKKGQLNGDMWVAIEDVYNEWIEIGNSPHNPCILHLKDLGAAPGWGIRTDGSQVKHVGFIYCCSGSGAP